MVKSLKNPDYIISFVFPDRCFVSDPWWRRNLSVSAFVLAALATAHWRRSRALGSVAGSVRSRQNHSGHWAFGWVSEFLTGNWSSAFASGQVASASTGVPGSNPCEVSACQLSVVRCQWPPLRDNALLFSFNPQVGNQHVILMRLSPDGCPLWDPSNLVSAQFVPPAGYPKIQNNNNNKRNKKNPKKKWKLFSRFRTLTANFDDLTIFQKRTFWLENWNSTHKCSLLIQTYVPNFITLTINT